jgi:hypothetical protein
MLNSFLDNPAAAAAGFFALVCLAVWPLFRTRNGILLAQLGAGIGFTIHYALLGIAAPSLVNLLGSVQTSAALFSTRSTTLNRIGYGLIPLMIGAGIYFWTGPTSALCVAAMGLIALGRMQRNQWTLRLLILAGSVFWCAHDYLVASWIALGADLLSLTMGLAMLANLAFAETLRRRAAVPAKAAI